MRTLWYCWKSVFWKGKWKELLCHKRRRFFFFRNFRISRFWFKDFISHTIWFFINKSALKNSASLLFSALCEQIEFEKVVPKQRSGRNGHFLSSNLSSISHAVFLTNDCFRLMKNSPSCKHYILDDSVITSFF